MREPFVEWTEPDTLPSTIIAEMKDMNIDSATGTIPKFLKFKFKYKSQVRSYAKKWLKYLLIPNLSRVSKEELSQAFTNF